MRGIVVLLVLGALGCKGEPDTDTDIDIDTDTDEDIPDTFLGRTEKPSDVERAGVDLRAGLLAVTIEGDGSWTIGDFLAGSRLSGTGNFGIELPDAAPDGIIDLPGGRRGALFLPIVYDDVDRDEVFADNDDDLVLGFAEDRWLVYLETAAEGESTGWQVIDTTVDGYQVYRRTEQAAIRLYGLSATSRLQGIYEGSKTGVGVVAIDERVPGGGIDTWSPLDVMVDAENGQFDETAEGRPPVDAFQFPDDVQIRFVRATLRLYEDTDASGSFDPAVDTLLDQGLCYEGAPLVARYSDTPRTVAIARDIASLEWTTGWRFVTGPYGASTEVNRRDLQWYTYGDDCAL